MKVIIVIASNDSDNSNIDRNIDIACGSCNIFTAGQLRVKSDRCPRVCYYYAEMLRLNVVQKMRDVSSETPMCYD